MSDILVLLRLISSVLLAIAVSNGNFAARADSSASNSSSVYAPPTGAHPTSQPHTPFSGTPSTTGALTATSIGKGISSGSVAAEATTYSSDGKLHNAEPAPFVPAGGIGTNGSTPVYNAKSDFDYESLALALYQEWIELDLFQDGLSRFSEADFSEAGLTSKDRDLISFMVAQEVGHATMLSNILGASAPQPCTYNYPYTTVREFIDFCQKLTRFGEAGVYGFLAHLNSREAASLLTQSITTEARQQMIFRQFGKLFPMPEWFEVGIPQSWAWTLLAPYISSCPGNQTRLVWQNFPALRILNQPSLATAGMTSNSSNGSAVNNTISPGINVVKTPNRSSNSSSSSDSDCGVTVTSKPAALSFAGRYVILQWENAGKRVGPNNSYVTSSQAKTAKYVAWVSQLNVTYTSLGPSHNGTYGYTVQPDLDTYEGDPAVNGTMFIAITDDNPVLTPFNLSLINPHVVAGPAIYQAG
ncbi:Protein rds1 [Penicillium macrosclerotiorum]|uniref:Protein rds1 n=1 Tax=Penicillium macrosclerotiorum TaxID=303699 RepID=UPI002546F49D|nr:Protein rds1 [Penicillium macrosclerotiorum]KAJ5690187.1 Protein rds1 [Penicillium macrosclerotiorum]